MKLSSARDILTIAAQSCQEQAILLRRSSGSHEAMQLPSAHVLQILYGKAVWNDDIILSDDVTCTITQAPRVALNP